MQLGRGKLIGTHDCVVEGKKSSLRLQKKKYIYENDFFFLLLSACLSVKKNLNGNDTQQGRTIINRRSKLMETITKMCNLDAHMYTGCFKKFYRLGTCVHDTIKVPLGENGVKDTGIYLRICLTKRAYVEDGTSKIHRATSLTIERHTG